jgi:hypothetical protein
MTKARAFTRKLWKRRRLRMGRRKRYLESLGDLPAWGAAAEAKLRLAHRLRFCCMKRILFDTGPITGMGA